MTKIGHIIHDAKHGRFDKLHHLDFIPESCDFLGLQSISFVSLDGCFVDRYKKNKFYYSILLNGHDFNIFNKILGFKKYGYDCTGGWKEIIIINDNDEEYYENNKDCYWKNSNILGNDEDALCTILIITTSLKDFVKNKLLLSNCKEIGKWNI